MNYIKLYIGDYLKKTGALTVGEHGAYFLMLLHYYATEAPLPEGRDLYRLVRAESKQERADVDSIAVRYWTRTESGWVHERADEEIRKADAARDKHVAAGRKGGRPRKQMETKLVLETEPKQKPRESNTNTITNTSASLRSAEGARATRLPPDWQPDDEGWQLAVTEAGGTEQARRELAKFRDFWAAKAGADGRKLDWPATWRNWVRKAGDYAKSGRNSAAGRESAVDRVRRLNAAALEDGSEILAPDDGNLRPQVDVSARRDADGTVVDGAFRVVG